MTQTIERPDYVTQLARTSFTTMPFMHDYRPLLSAWERFLGRPDKDRFTIDLSTDQRPDHGYFKRNGMDGTHDCKDTFHYRTNLARMYQERKVPVDGELNILLQYCGLLYQKVLMFATDVATRVDQAVEGLDVAAKIQAMGQNALQDPLAGHVIRLVSYIDPGDGQLAEPHLDHSFLTFHLWDSHPGLFLGKKQPLAYRSLMGRVAVFPGKRMAICSRGRIGALWHHASGEQVAKGSRRTAIIFFLHTDDPLSAYEQYKESEK